MKEFKIFTINPGSTSTKVALFYNDTKVFSDHIVHSVKELAAFKETNAQLSYRRDIILQSLAAAGFPLAGTDAFAGRAGGFERVAGGTYMVNDLMLEHARSGFRGHHPANLGVQLCDEFSKIYGGKSYTVNMPTTDEFQEVARITGLAGVFRESGLHALNQKEVAIRYAQSVGKKYDEMNFVVCHMGGGISITAHRCGQMVDSSAVQEGEGPMAPTRSGTLVAVDLLKMALSGEYTYHELYERVTRNGGWIDHLGTSDGLEVMRMIDQGDRYAKLVYDATIYQIAKYIGMYASVLKGNVDAVLLTGGLAKNRQIVESIRDMVCYIAPVIAYPGEYEMEALASGVLRVLTGQEEIKEYTGVEVYDKSWIYEAIQERRSLAPSAG